MFFRFASESGLKSDPAGGPFCAKGGNSGCKSRKEKPPEGGLPSDRALSLRAFQSISFSTNSSPKQETQRLSAPIR
jgi:hypothetical protein